MVGHQGVRLPRGRDKVVTSKVLVACVGNRLRTDDAIGPIVGDFLEAEGVPDHVTVQEIGIGGIHLVQSLMGGEFNALVVVDCADHGREPGTVMVIQPEVLDVNKLDHIEKYDYLADMHYTKPERAFALARALGVLPETFLLVGIQPLDAETLSRSLTPVVEASVHIAAHEVLRIIGEFDARA